MIDFKDKLFDLCYKGAIKKKLTDKIYLDRLQAEIKDIDNQNEYEYFIDLYNNKIRYKFNYNNLLVVYLLEIVDEFDINKDSKYTYGDFPDVDVDYVDTIAEYIKNDWAPKTFGEKHVCNIGNYATLGIKNALIDTARVYGYDYHEIQAITTKLELKDDEGKELTWEKAIELNKDLAEYCKKYPEVAIAAEKLIGRCRGRGKHAGGLIVSSIPVDDVIPLCIDKDGNPISSWPEGLKSQDLGPVGFIKYDVLVLTNLKQIGYACHLIKQRHGLESICAKPGLADWSDDSYLNDSKSLELANRAELKGIFQYDSDGIRKLAKEGGVDSFDDLASYAALYRPGPMGEMAHKTYVLRKKGLEKYEIHPLLEDILGKTYGVIVYQEQIAQILNKIGKVPLKDCETIRKAISKKKEKIFKAYKDNFIENGQKILNWSKEQVLNLWKQIEAFADYGFNKAHAHSYTIVSSRLLWLKAHYPLEFFTSILYFEKQSDKIKEYKLEASRHGIEVCKVDLNKSKEFASITDDKIYLGFANIKGIGTEVASDVVNNQPYFSYEEFINKYGCDSKVIKPLIGLGIFGDEREKLLKYGEYYKKESKKKKAVIIPYAEYNNDVKIDEELKLLYSKEINYAEQKYYGFAWKHIIEDYLDYDPSKTFTQFDDDEDLINSAVQIKIVEKPKEYKSKKGTPYYQIVVEDSNSRTERITFWQDDFEKFREELMVWDDIEGGNVLSCILQKPGPGFKNYTFFSPPKHLKAKILSPDKLLDYRLKVMKNSK